MAHPPEPFPVRLRVYLRWTALLALTFVVVYGGLNAWTAHRALRFHLYWQWELAIPMLPEAILAYMSVQVLFLLPLWCLSAERIALLGRAMLLAIIVAGLVFALLPAELGFQRAVADGWVAPLYALVYALDAPHNLLPSLHVALGTLALAFLAREASARLRAWYAAWWVCLCASVVLTHQHHLLDVITGMILALGCYACSGATVRSRSSPGEV